MLVHPDVHFTNALAEHRQALENTSHARNSKTAEPAVSRTVPARAALKRLRPARS